MRALIRKELWENIKWVPLPGLVILLVFLVEKPVEPILDTTDAYFFCLTAVVFGMALGFVQVFFEGHGDKRSVLLHRPLTPSRIFVAKALAGMTLYLLALAIPFLTLERWYATPGNIATPYHWRTSLPWLADILSGLVYYFAGMLIAQREARWYGSRGLPLAAAFFCSYLVWALPEFWQALVAIGIFGLLVGVAAWGSFSTGGAYTPLPRLPRFALGMTMLLGLVILSMLGKQRIGESLDAGMHYQVDLDRHGRVLFSTHQEGRGETAITDINGQSAGLIGNRFWGADSTFLDWPVHWGYRHNSRFYFECRNESSPGNERWLYDPAQGRLLGYDRYSHHFLGSFGRDGFKPAGQQPGERFQGEVRYFTNRGMYMTSEYLIFPDGVYFVDFVRRSIRKFFAAAPGETVNAARYWRDEGKKRSLVLISTNQSMHVVTEDGLRVISMPKAYSSEERGPIFVGRLKDPERYFVWYHLRYWLREPHEYRDEPSYLIEYDLDGHELAHRAVPPFPYPASSYAQALYGLITPMTEAAALVGTSKYVRWLARSHGSTRKYSLIDYLESFQYYIPGTATMATTLSPASQPSRGLMAGYITLILLSAAASGLACFVLARRYAFSGARRMGWTACGFFFGWVGLLLMLVLQDWPARITCPKCRNLRVVIRERCEQCGAAHAVPAPDGTEVFGSAPTTPPVALTAS